MNNIHPTMRPFLWFAPPCRATGNHLAAQNDEPEADEGIATRDWPMPPVKSFRQIEAEANASVREELRRTEL